MTVTELLAITLALIVAVPFVIWFILQSLVRPAFAMALGLGLAVFSLTHFGAPGLRYALALALMPHLGYAIRRYRLGSTTSLPPFAVPLAYVSVCFTSIIWSLDPTKTLAAGLAWLILLLFVFTFRSLLASEAIRRIIFSILLLSFVSSVAFLVSSEGWEANRARGIFTNANSAGIFTFFLIGVSLWMGKKYWIWIVPSGLVFIVASGSRASLLATVILLLVAMVSAVERRLRLAVSALLLFAGIPVSRWAWNRLQQIEVDSESVLRTNNSRERTWGAAFSFIQENPVFGAGYRATPPLVGSSSFIKLVAEFGFGFSIFGCLLVGAYFWWSRYDPIMLGITLGAFANTIFEDWLLTAGAPMLAVYLLLVMSTPQRRLEDSASGPIMPTGGGVARQRIYRSGVGNGRE